MRRSSTKGRTNSCPTTDRRCNRSGCIARTLRTNRRCRGRRCIRFDSRQRSARCWARSWSTDPSRSVGLYRSAVGVAVAVAVMFHCRPVPSSRCRPAEANCRCPTDRPECHCRPARSDCPSRCPDRRCRCRCRPRHHPSGCWDRFQTESSLRHCRQPAPCSRRRREEFAAARSASERAARREGVREAPYRARIDRRFSASNWSGF